MQEFKKKTLALALAATIGAGAISLSAPAMAGNGGPAADNIGNALIYQYYTVRDGFRTTFNVTNVTDKSLAVKVRFHEAHNTRDVFDFVLMLSPRDVWSGWLSSEEQDGETVAVLHTNDNSCTSPVKSKVDGAVLNKFAYTDVNDDGGVQTNDRTLEGHITMIVMGEAMKELGADEFDEDTQQAPYYSEHEQKAGELAEPLNCTEADKQWVPTVTWTDTTFAPGSGEPPAEAQYDAPFTPSITGTLAMINGEGGEAGAVNAVALKNFYGAPGCGTFGAGKPFPNLITAQKWPYFLEPTLASSNGIWDASGLGYVDSLLRAYTVINEWGKQAADNRATDWVITSPTKAYHVDRPYVWTMPVAAPAGTSMGSDQIQAGANGWRALGCTWIAPDAVATPTPLMPFEHIFADPDDPLVDKDSPVTVKYNIWDREEGSVVITTDGTDPSPAPPPEIKIDTLRYETNVLTVGGNSSTSSLQSGLNQLVAASDLLESKAPNGWMRMDYVSLAAMQTGLPTVGFMFKIRTNVAETGKNFGQATDHALCTMDPYMCTDMNNL